MMSELGSSVVYHPTSRGSSSNIRHASSMSELSAVVVPDDGAPVDSAPADAAPEDAAPLVVVDWDGSAPSTISDASTPLVDSVG
jgi:hypothetical protein